jgi:hypothetical protein
VKFLYRRGDGSSGNVDRFHVTLTDNDAPQAALKALVASDFPAGSSARRHILKIISVSGDVDGRIHATVQYGPPGDRTHRSTWLTAELTPVGADQVAGNDLRSKLDGTAWRMYRADINAGQ